MVKELIRDPTAGKLSRDSASGKLMRVSGYTTDCLYCAPDPTPAQIAVTFSGLVDCTNCILMYGSYYKPSGIASMLNGITHVLDHLYLPPPDVNCQWKKVYTGGYFGSLLMFGSDDTCTAQTGHIDFDMLTVAVTKTASNSLIVALTLRTVTGWIFPIAAYAFSYIGTASFTNCLAVSGLSNQLVCASATPFQTRVCSSGVGTIIEGPAAQSWYQLRLPTGDAAVQWSPVSDNYLLVNDPPDDPDDDDSYTYTETGWDKDYFSFPAFSIPAGSTITSVQITGRFRRMWVGGSYLARLLLRVNGVTYYGPSEQFVIGAYFTRTATWATNPATGLAWTLDDVNGIGSNPLQNFGYECMGFQKLVRCTQVYAKVNYTN